MHRTPATRQGAESPHLSIQVICGAVLVPPMEPIVPLPVSLIPTSPPVMSFGINDRSQSQSKFPVLSREQFSIPKSQVIQVGRLPNWRQLTTREKSPHIDESGFSMNGRSEPGLTRDHRPFSPSDPLPRTKPYPISKAYPGITHV